MLRPIIHLIKDRRIRSVVVDNGQQSNPSLITTEEDGASRSQTGSGSVSVDSLSASHALGESRQGEPCVVSRHNSEWIEVDLSGSGSVRNEVGTCISRLDINGSNDWLNNGEGATVEIRTASASNLRDASSVNSTGGENNASDQILLSTVNLQPSLGKDVLQNSSQLQPVLSDTSYLQHGTVDIHKTQDAASGSATDGIFPRTVSAFSTDSLAEYCRICQQPSDEPLIELGCHCRGDLAKTHRTCIQKWFKNKGSNKCEVCRHVAANLPPVSAPLHNFWVWRINRPYGRIPFQRWQGRGQLHPLLAVLLILVAGLLFDVLISYYLGASALPVNIIIGVLVVLGLGTAGRLIVECWHEQRIRRLVRRMDLTADINHVQSDHGLINIDLSS